MHKKIFTNSLMVLMTLFFSTLVSASNSESDRMTTVARKFVKLGLQAQNHDKLPYVYFGPEEWLTEAQSKDMSIPEIQESLKLLKKELSTWKLTEVRLENDRRELLRLRIDALIARLDVLQGVIPASFDEETQQIFGVTVPKYSEEHFAALSQELEKIIPGKGDISKRVDAFRRRFVIPPEKVEAVISAAIKECRRRTGQHLVLPEHESITLNMTSGQDWVGFAEYQGNGHSRIHINTEVPIHIERVIQLGCHEGYPGHHVHATLVEEELVKKRGWIEYAFIPLNGPTAVIAEGIANYGVDLAFTTEERIDYERNVILPMAGLNGDQLELYYQYFSLLDKLNYARNEVARQFLFQGKPREEAIQWLMQYGLESRGTASQRLDFIASMRTYVINYNYGKKLVKDYIQSQAGDDRKAKWRIFYDVITSPLYPQKMLGEAEVSKP